MRPGLDEMMCRRSSRHVTKRMRTVQKETGESVGYAQSSRPCREQVDKRFKSLSLIRGQFVDKAVAVDDEAKLVGIDSD